MKLYVSMTGVPELRRAFSELTPEIERALKVAVAQTANIVELGAMSRVPVLTGELRDTIRTEYAKGGLVAFIKAGYGTLRRRSRSKTGKRRRGKSPQAPGIYAMVVEFGGKNRPAHPFLFPALESARPGFEARALGALEPAIQRAVDKSGANPK